MSTTFRAFVLFAVTICLPSGVMATWECELKVFNNLPESISHSLTVLSRDDREIACCISGVIITESTTAECASIDLISEPVSTFQSFMVPSQLPEMAYFGGLCGIAMAHVVYLALNGRRFDLKLCWLWISLLLLCFLKLVFEMQADQFVFVDVENDKSRPVPLSHLMGMFSGLLVYLYSLMERQFFSFNKADLGGFSDYRVQHFVRK